DTVSGGKLIAFYDSIFFTSMVKLSSFFVVMLYYTFLSLISQNVMALIHVVISMDDYTVHKGSFSAGDTSELIGPGRCTLTLDNVNAIADIDPDAPAAGTPTFALINGGDLTVNIGTANFFNLDGINYEIGDGSEMTLNGSLSQAGLASRQSIDFTGEGGGTF